jgi:hypothetical protein
MTDISDSPDNDTDNDDMVIGLEQWARGAYDCEAAVMMLTRCSLWPRFSNSLLAHRAIGWGDRGAAWIDRDALESYANDNAMSGGEQRTLWLAASLLGVSSPPLGRLLSGVDEVNVAVFLQAAAHLAGWHEQGETLLVTGRIGT